MGDVFDVGSSVVAKESDGTVVRAIGLNLTGQTFQLLTAKLSSDAGAGVEAVQTAKRLFCPPRSIVLFLLMSDRAQA